MRIKQILIDLMLDETPWAVRIHFYEKNSRGGEVPQVAEIPFTSLTKAQREAVKSVVSKASGILGRHGVGEETAAQGELGT